MISKILLTLTVIGLAWLVIRNRQRRMTAVGGETPPPALQKRPDRLIKWVGYGVLGLMLSGGALYFAWQVKESYRLVTVTVIDTQSGRSVSYSARRMDVEARRFVTLEGREVTVADNERIELEPVNGDGLP